MSWAATRHSSSRLMVRASGSSTAVAVASWTSFNIGVSLPAGVNRRNRCLVNLEGTSRPSGDGASTTSGYNSVDGVSTLYRWRHRDLHGLCHQRLFARSAHRLPGTKVKRMDTLESSCEAQL